MGVAHSTCTIDSCDKRIHGRGYCSYHYQKHVPMKSAPKAICKTDGCERKVYAKGFCSACYQQLRWHKMKDGNWDREKESFVVLVVSAVILIMEIVFAANIINNTYENATRLSS